MLRKEADTEVELIDGDKGEFTVSVDGRVVAKKVDESLPEPGEILAAVWNAERPDRRPVKPL
jgi:hypothetical protein